MAHKMLRGRKKPRKATSVRRTMKNEKHNRKQSREMKEKARKKKEEEREKKAAELAARKEAVLALRKAEEEEAARKAAEEVAQAAAPKKKKGKKRKAAEAAAAVPDAAAATTPEAAGAAAPEAGAAAAPKAATAAAPEAAAPAAAPEAAAAAPAAAGAAAKPEEPARPPTRKEKKELKMQAALARHHQLLYGNGRILLVGEGNFSFARGLCRHLGGGEGVYATCLDGESLLKRKYPDAAECRKEVEEKHGGTTLVGVDATRLHEVREFRRSFRTIVWNFPHIGGGESDMEKSIADHQRLLADFFKSADKCLSEEDGSSIHVSLKTCEPYKSWKLKQTAKMVCPELELSKVVAFAPAAWSGYEHRRTHGFDERFSKRDSEELAAGAKVYVFTRGRAPGRAAAE